MISPNPYYELKLLGLSFISDILYEIGKFLSNSEMVHVQASKALQHVVGMTVEALVFKKMLSLPRYTMAKKGCTVIQGQNQFNFSCSNNGKKISSTFFLSDQNITSYWYGQFSVLLIFWCLNWEHSPQLKLVECDKDLLRSTALP